MMSRVPRTVILRITISIASNISSVQTVLAFVIIGISIQYSILHLRKVAKYSSGFRDRAYAVRGRHGFPFADFAPIVYVLYILIS
jgi:hypothetical protein